MMKVQDLIAIRGRQKQLQLQREKKIKYRLINKQKQQLADTSDQRKSNKQKTKRIQKKKIQTIKEKIIKQTPQLQSNVNVETFMNESSDYKKYLQRTKKCLTIDGEQLLNNIEMLKTVCQTNKRNNPLLSVHIKFDNQINPPIRPFQMKLPYPRKIESVLIIAENLSKLKENIQDWKQRYNLQLLTLREFRTNFKDTQFHSKVMSSNTLIFCDFKDFQDLCNSPIYSQVAQKNAVFPIQTKKIPRSLQAQYKSYGQFIESLCQYSYFLIRPGHQYIVHLGHLTHLSSEKNVQNITEGIAMIVSRLLFKNKTKGAKVSAVNLRTTFSIPVQIYEAE